MTCRFESGFGQVGARRMNYHVPGFFHAYLLSNYLNFISNLLSYRPGDRKGHFRHGKICKLVIVVVSASYSLHIANNIEKRETASAAQNQSLCG